MSKVRELHDQAMEFAELAMIARYSGEQEKAAILTRQAFELESQAADLIPCNQDSEPTRSILYRSAASLAFQCKELQTAQRLVAIGLSGFPPAEIRHELENLFTQIKFERKLQEEDIVLEDNDIQLSLGGNAIGEGIVPLKEFDKRVWNLFNLATKTIQRKMGRELQKTGKVAKIYQPFVPTIAAPGPGSFIITLKFQRLQDSEQLSFLCDTDAAISEVLDGIRLLNERNETRLREIVKDDAYYYNFVSLARELAPDGVDVSSVGIVSKSQRINLTRYYDDIPLMTDLDIEQDQDRKEYPPIIVEGKLDYASIRTTERIGLTTEENRHYNIEVHAGLEELVRSFFGQWVRVTGTCNQDSRTPVIFLTDIRPIDKDE